MKMFIPSSKGNGGNKSKTAKSGQRREQRKRNRLAAVDDIYKDVEARKDRALGMRVQQNP
ncbi:hypothetical protein A2765_06600 [Candidatus Kaiserbacteria bacterium RIFCSPHIGHO2_01_FULL_56_24]|uniref:Uncharacterized protein n=1 Tax=Candidatus Kaiserbacteria bacterium RIFCSPHIGHO2_01_FULL_56_24 TaxID=1798487 RepID=A0A1F6DCE9_9BACT|nr:MAG: hypothetical protein A2765_06600 [Candidatus Kaiserbacteria bacterium RIFCSPHIGHO2_01_FULL_56_24]